MKSLNCHKCGILVDNVGDDTEKVKCSYCTMKELEEFDADEYYEKEEKVKMPNGEKKPMKKSGLTLTCSVCGVKKKAGRKRYEKWKNTKYVCRKCRKKQKK